MVDSDSPEQAYLQVANDLGRRIQAGEIRGRLTSERDLAGEYEVSYGTIRRAMGILRDRGLVVSVHGRGTFATARRVPRAGRACGPDKGAAPRRRPS